MKKNLILFILLLITLFSCQTTQTKAFQPIKKVQKKFDIENIPQKEDYPEAEAVIILYKDEEDIHFGRDYGIYGEQKVHVIKKVFRNIDEHSTETVPIMWFEKLNYIQARIIKPDGTIVNLENDDFIRMNISNDKTDSEDADMKSISFTFPKLEKNAIIEYKYSITSDDPFKFSSWDIQKSIPIMVNEFSLTVPKFIVTNHKWTWRFKPYNIPNLPKPKVTDCDPFAERFVDKKLRFDWRLENISAFEKEPLMPPTNLYKSFIQFSPSEWETWNDISKWYYKSIFAPKLKLTPEIKNKAQELIKECKTDEEKIQKIFDFTQKIRYESVDFGIGGITPNTPAKVLEKEYGDCKNKSILLIALLKSLNFTAKPVLLMTSDNGFTDPSFPSLRFNHMIVKAFDSQNNPYWLDPTTKFCVINEIPWYDEGINVLVLNEDGSSNIEVTPIAQPSQNRTISEIIANINSENKINFKAKIAFKGEYNGRKRRQFENFSDEEIKDYCKSLIKDNYINVEINNYSFSKIEDYQKNFVLEFDFEIPEAINQQGDLFFLNVFPLKVVNKSFFFDEKERNYPIKFYYPRVNTIKTIINYPAEKFNVRNIPENYNDENENLFFARKGISNSSNQIIFNQEFVIKNNFIKPEKYQETKNFFDSLKGNLNKQIIFKESN